MGRAIIIANWKMHKTIRESLIFVRALKKKPLPVKKVVVICPPFTSLSAVAREIRGTNIKLGAQNMYCREEGAFTGEISPLMLRCIGVEYVIVGHSERREYFNEDNNFINMKIKSALKNKIKPILCVGEKEVERKRGLTKRVIKKQIFECLSGVPKDQVSNILIAYEPVWAIGTGKTARPEDAEEVHSFIRLILGKKFSKKLASIVPILYGGSVTPKNIGSLMAMGNIDGALVGGASLKIKSFVEILKNG